MVSEIVLIEDYILLPPIIVSTHKKVRGAVFQVYAGEISWRAANADNKFARLQAAHMDLERQQSKPVHNV